MDGVWVLEVARLRPGPARPPGDGVGPAGVEEARVELVIYSGDYVQVDSDGGDNGRGGVEGWWGNEGRKATLVKVELVR